MKKLIVLLVFVGMSIGVFGQSIWKPVPKNLLFENKDRDITLNSTSSTWLWRFSAVIAAQELVYDKTLKEFTSHPLSSIGPAIGYRHFVSLPDGTPYNDFGINAALLIGGDINQIELTKMKLALLVNAFKFINVGTTYTLNSTNKFGILLGGSVNF